MDADKGDGDLRNSICAEKSKKKRRKKAQWDGAPRCAF